LRALMDADNAANSLMFRCPTTGNDFESGFKANSDELKSIPSDYKMIVRYKSCFETHEFIFSESRIAATPAKKK
jgi:hypothetical protein